MLSGGLDDCPNRLLTGHALNDFDVVAVGITEFKRLGSVCVHMKCNTVGSLWNSVAQSGQLVAVRMKVQRAADGPVPSAHAGNIQR